MASSSSATWISCLTGAKNATPQRAGKLGLDLTWSCCPIAVALVGNDKGLIQCDPKLHFVPQPLEEHICIVFKSLYDGLILPASDILECLGQVPVVNCHLQKRKSSPIYLLFMGTQ